MNCPECGADFAPARTEEDVCPDCQADIFCEQTGLTREELEREYDCDDSCEAVGSCER